MWDICGIKLQMSRGLICKEHGVLEQKLHTPVTKCNPCHVLGEQDTSVAAAQHARAAGDNQSTEETPCKCSAG